MHQALQATSGMVDLVPPASVGGGNRGSVDQPQTNMAPLWIPFDNST